MRGYFGIGVYHTKNELNIGTLWRSAQNFGAAFIFTVGKRYRQQASDTLKTARHIPLYHFETLEHFRSARPMDCPLVGIEQCGDSVDICDYKHPERAIYLLGAEDAGLPRDVQDRCNSIVHISTPMCLNVAVAGSIVMFDRATKQPRRVAA